MEEENKTTQPTEQPPHTQPSHEAKSPKFSFKKWPILLFAVLLLIILLMGGYIAMSKDQPTAEKKIATDDIELTQLTEAPTPTTTESKTFTSNKFDSLSFKGYSLSYPEDWTLSEQRDATVPISTVTLTKEGYTLKIFQAATGGAQCVYEGAMVEGPASDYRNAKYMDLVSFATLRQTESPANGKMAYAYCQKNAEDGSFGQPTSVGHMSVTTGVATADPDILSEIETIVKSIKTL